MSVFLANIFDKNVISYVTCAPMNVSLAPLLNRSCSEITITVYCVEMIFHKIFVLAISDNTTPRSSQFTINRQCSMHRWY